MTDCELNELVALNIMGWKLYKNEKGEWRVYSPDYGETGSWLGISPEEREAKAHDFLQCTAPNYLTWSGMGLVVEEMLKSPKKYKLKLEWLLFEYPKEWGWYAAFTMSGEGLREDHYAIVKHKDAAPRAVAIAALRAVGVEVE